MCERRKKIAKSTKSHNICNISQGFAKSAKVRTEAGPSSSSPSAGPSEPKPEPGHPLEPKPKPGPPRAQARAPLKPKPGPLKPKSGPPSSPSPGPPRRPTQEQIVLCQHTTRQRPQKKKKTSACAAWCTFPLSTRHTSCRAFPVWAFQPPQTPIYIYIYRRISHA